jgi:WD40 repeat protein
MHLEAGTLLGVYQVTAKVGAGGMGEVYKARDTQLDRDVALKILPEACVSDPERLVRFRREAKVLASLNHPNIAAIYGLEESGDSPALVSPEGGRVALSVGSDRGHDVFVYDIARDSMTRLTSSGDANLWPVWAPDGEHVAYTSLTDDQGVLWWAPADGTSPPERLHAGPNGIRQIAISPDGRYIGYTGQDPETGGDLWILPLEYDGSGVPTAGEARAAIQTAFGESVPAFSPDGRWLAYTSNELGPYGVWVQDFPDLSGRWRATAATRSGRGRHLNSSSGARPDATWSRTRPMASGSFQADRSCGRRRPSRRCRSASSRSILHRTAADSLRSRTLPPMPRPV